MHFEYTHHNYFHWGFQKDHLFSGVPENADQVDLWFDVCPKYLNRPPASYRDETIHAAKLIGDRADKPITLFVSGGIDSEVMVLACMDAGLKFDCSIIAYEYGINHHEVEIARALCERWNLKHDFIRLDPFRLWYNPPGWMNSYRMESGVLYGMLAGIDQRWDRFQICGGNPVIRTYKSDPSVVTMEVRKAVLCHMLLWMDRYHPSVSLFHMYTPEQLYCWVNHPLIRAWQKQVVGSKVFDFDQIKTLFYQMEFPEISFSRPKWTGEEFIRNHISDLWQNQWAENRPFNPIFRRNLHEIQAILDR